MKKPRFNIDEAVRLFHTGLNNKQIAERVGVTAEAVRYRLLQHGLYQRIVPNSPIRRARKKRGHTQTDLARLIPLRGKYCHQTIRRWEHGQMKPTKKHIKRLCEIYPELKKDFKK